MKSIINIALVVAAISLILGIISRFTLIRVPIARGGGIEAQAFLAFTNTCLLLVITLTLLQIAKKKE